MDKNEAIEYVRNNAADILPKDKSGKGYICPICNSGSGKNGTGLTTKDGQHFTCWAGCYTNSDIIDIMGQKHNLTAFNDKLNKTFELFNIDVTDQKEYSTFKKVEKALRIEPLPEEKEDYTAFFLQAHSNINKTDYPQTRGLSKKIIDRFNLGYVETWQSPKALKEGKKPPTSPRLIIPTSAHSYLARETREKRTDYSVLKEGGIELFNTAALNTGKPVFITEGEIDALSIIEAGGEALALGSVANIKKLLTFLTGKTPAHPLLIAMDNDIAGQKAAAELAEGLEKLGIKHYNAGIAEGYKDANEALIADRQELCESIKRAENIENAEQEAYKQTSAASHLQEFLNGIKDSVNTPYIPTGFTKLDEALDGGLYEGLYIIGAIPSLGKTTLALQTADQIAKQGQDVLIFSLEMARTELMAKSISRLTLESVLSNVIDNNGSIRNAKTARGITTGSRYENYSPQEKELIKTAITTYSEYAGNIYISEGIGNIGVKEIREAVAKHILLTGKTPVILIDYIQIIMQGDSRATDKQNIDKAVIELKRISRDYKAAVIGISSFNRSNYKTEVSMEAFKESGGIEYSSDVLIGLQLKGAGGKDFDANAAKDKNPREIELVVLKNRNGATGKKLEYEYYPLFNYFREV
ncbi:MAG: DNA primase [Epsilonproteobacteria bacterium]|nr:DNA primase [Campylobacterota bacterium]